ncbi:MAG: hypothetical protein V3W34_12640, partial [Phycisphaerae bacterium]
GSVGPMGSVHVWGDVETGGTLKVRAACVGGIELGTLAFGLGNIGGSIDVGSVSSTGIIRVWGDVADGSTVSVASDMAGQVHLLTDLHGSLYVGGDMSGSAFHVHKTVRDPNNTEPRPSGSGKIVRHRPLPYGRGSDFTPFC